MSTKTKRFLARFALRSMWKRNPEMKKLLLAGVLLLPFMASASSLCSDQTDWSFATWSAAGFSCEANDLVFSNFSVSNVPSNMALNFSTDAAGDTINLNLVNGTFAQTFSFSYPVTLDDRSEERRVGKESRSRWS